MDIIVDSLRCKRSNNIVLGEGKGVRHAHLFYCTYKYEEKERNSFQVSLLVSRDGESLGEKTTRQVTSKLFLCIL